MYCQYCGKEIADNSKFCPYCGNALSGNETTQMTAPIQPVKPVEPVYEPVRNNNEGLGDVISRMDPKQKRTYAVVFGGIVIAAIVAAMLLLGPKRVTLTDVYTPRVYGYDGYGYAYLEFKEDGKMYKDYVKTWEKYSEGCIYPDESKKCQDLYDRLSAMESVLFNSSCSLSKSDGLSNGDKIHAACIIDAPALTNAGYTGTFTKDITVSGLEPIVEKDLFDGLRFEWVYGDWGYELHQVTSDERLENVYYYVDLSTMDKEGNAVVYVGETLEELKQYSGIIPTNEELNKTMYVGLPPEKVTSVKDDKEKEVLLKIGEERMNALADKCGWNLWLSSSTQYVIASYDFVKFQSSYDGITLIYNVVAEGKNYTKEIYLGEVYRMPDGSLIDHEKFDPSEAGCGISGKYWVN